MEYKEGNVALFAMISDIVCTVAAAFLIFAGLVTFITGAIVPALLMWILSTLLWIASNQMPKYYQEEH